MNSHTSRCGPAQCDHTLPLSSTAQDTSNAGNQFTWPERLRNISTEVSANISKFIFGDRSLDEWDDFVATLKSMGLEECQKVQQAAYERWLARVK